jgi:exopolysaccharide biosynthesis polyprenyl glycosylphosphotransferase
MNAFTVPRTEKHPISNWRLLSLLRVGSAPARRSTTPWPRAYNSKLRITDSLVILIAVALAYWGRFTFEDPASFTADVAARFSVLCLLTLLCWGVGLAVFRSRDPKVIGVGASEYKRVVNATTTVFGLIAITFVVAEVATARWFFTITLPVGLAGIVGSRWLWRQWLVSRRKSGQMFSRVVVVGRRYDVEKVVRQIGANRGSGYFVMGAVLDDGDDAWDGPVLQGMSIRRGLDAVPQYAEELGADAIVVAGQPRGDGEFIHDLAWQLEGKTVELILATSLANVAGPRIHFRPVDGLPLLHVEIPQFEGGKHLFKRMLDVVIAGLALLLLAPLFALIALLIRADSPGGAFFCQERVGRGGRLFRIWKFRSMVAAAPQLQATLAALSEGNGVLFKMKNDPRVTRLGKTLRKYSLDELPQLWNVFVGDMSLVGPRPPLPNEVEEYEEHVLRRLYIKPGLTGMWQINGRSSLSWEDSVRLDLYYVENWSVVGDIMIMWRTFRVLIRPVGAY